MDDKITYFWVLEIQSAELAALSVLGDYFTDFVHEGRSGCILKLCFDYKDQGNSDKCLHAINSNQKNIGF